MMREISIDAMKNVTGGHIDGQHNPLLDSVDGEESGGVYGRVGFDWDNDGTVDDWASISSTSGVGAYSVFDRDGGATYVGENGSSFFVAPNGLFWDSRGQWMSATGVDPYEGLGMDSWGAAYGSVFGGLVSPLTGLAGFFFGGFLGHAVNNGPSGSIVLGDPPIHNPFSAGYP